MIQIIECRFDALVRSACKACLGKNIENLLLTCKFDISEIDNPFLKSFENSAQQWQAIKKPDELLINHGSFINQYGDAKNFIVDELKRKKYGNRAFISLIDMKDIISSGDKAIPSFLILQFGFAIANENKLLITAYFRALEVANFLPINLAEIAMYIRLAKNSFPGIQQVELNILAFRAQNIPDFNCLKKSAIDVLEPVKICMAVLGNDKGQIVEMLKDKMFNEESIVCDEGLIHLSGALKEIKEAAKQKAARDIDEIVSKLTEMRKLRENTSIYDDQIKPLSDNIKQKLQKVINDIEEW